MTRPAPWIVGAGGTVTLDGGAVALNPAGMRVFWEVYGRLRGERGLIVLSVNDPAAMAEIGARMADAWRGRLVGLEVIPEEPEDRAGHAARRLLSPEHPGGPRWLDLTGPGWAGARRGLLVWLDGALARVCGSGGPLSLVLPAEDRAAACPALWAACGGAVEIVGGLVAARRSVPAGISGAEAPAHGAGISDYERAMLDRWHRLSANGEAARAVFSGQRAADALCRAGQPGEALVIAEALLAIRRGEGEAREIGEELARVGRIRWALGQAEGAAAALRERLEIQRARARAEGTAASDALFALEDLSAALEGMGDLCEAVGEVGEARRLCLERLAVDREVAARSGEDDHRGRLSDTLEDAGDLHEAAGEIGEARAALAERLEIRRALHLAGATPRSLRDLAVALIDLGLLDHPTPAARACYGEALPLTDLLARRFPDDPYYADLAPMLRQLLAELPPP